MGRYQRRQNFICLAVVVAVMLLNLVFFRLTVLDVDVLQSRDVWGKTQSLSKEALKLRGEILAGLPEDPTEAYLEVQQMLTVAMHSYLSYNSVIAQGMEWRNKYTEEERERLITTISDHWTDYEAVKDLLKQTTVYRSFIKSIENQAEGVITIPFWSDDYTINNALQVQKDYAGLQNLELTPVLEESFNAVINYRISDILLFVGAVTLALTGLVFLNQKGSDYFLGDPFGRWRGPIGVGLMTLGVLGCNLFLGLKDSFPYSWNIWLQSLEAYRTCPFRIRLGSFVILWMLVKLSFFFFVYFATVLVVYLFNRKKYWLGGLAVAAMGGAAVLSFFASDNGVMCFLKEINVWSAMTPERFFNRYLNLNVGGMAVSRPITVLIFWSVAFLLVLFFALRRYTIPLAI